MLKVWNIVLICMTFFLTIFGTFLTRSGLIASVHSFAQSGIGIFFVYFMGIIAATCTALIVYRLPRLRSEGRFESLLSREAAFLFNNWGFFSIMAFITVATVWPRISEWLLDQKSSLGPTFYNAWIPPVALTVFLLMGVAPLLGWRKTSPELFRKSFRWPVLAMVVVAAAHVFFGRRVGLPAFVEAEPIYEGSLGAGLARVASTYPFVTIAFTAFNIAVVVQEFARGIAARQRRGGESVFASLYNLVAKSRRRYGGYIVHVGIAVMFIGFAGRAWGVDKEVTMKPGDVVTMEEYRVTYQGTRMEVDNEKRMIFADLDVERHGVAVGRISPAKFIYKSMGDQPSSEVARHITLRNDLYVVLGMANPQTKAASFQIHVNNLISFLWFGGAILVLGAIVAMWPEITFEEAGAFAYVRAAGAVAASLIFGLLLAGGPAMAYTGPGISERDGPRIYAPAADPVRDPAQRTLDSE